MTDCSTSLLMMASFSSETGFQSPNSSILRVASCFLSPDLIIAYHAVLKSIDSNVTNIRFGDDNPAWTQATLPVRYGGLGFWNAVQLAPLTTAAASSGLISHILPASLQSLPIPHLLCCGEGSVHCVLDYPMMIVATLIVATFRPGGPPQLRSAGNRRGRQRVDPKRSPTAIRNPRCHPFSAPNWKWAEHSQARTPWLTQLAGVPPLVMSSGAPSRGSCRDPETTEQLQNLGWSHQASPILMKCAQME